MSMTARRFSLAVETDTPSGTGDLSQPISACLVDNRPEFSRHFSYDSVAPENHPLEPRRYSICDLNTLQDIPRSRAVSNEDGGHNTSDAIRKPAVNTSDDDEAKSPRSPGAVADVATTPDSPLASADAYSLDHGYWSRTTNHQRRNTTAIRFLLPKAASEIGTT